MVTKSQLPSSQLDMVAHFVLCAYMLGRFDPQAVQRPAASSGLLVGMAGSQPLPQLQMHGRAGLAPYLAS